MDKHYYRMIMGIYAAALVICGGARIALKMRYIDLETGFYIRSAPAALVNTFNIALLAAVVLLFVLSRLRRTTGDYPVYHHSRMSGVLCAATGLAILAYTLFDEPYPVLEQNQSELYLKVRGIICLVLGVLAALSMIGLGIGVAGGKVRRGIMVPALSASIWQIFLLITRFNTYTVLTNISDSLLAVLFMIFATLFLIGQARTIFGLTRKDGRNYTLPSGLCTSLLGFLLVIPNYLYMLVNRSAMPALRLGIWESVYALVLAVYSIVFVIEMIRSIKQV